MENVDHWPALLKDDGGLLEAIQATLTSQVQGDPYSSDGTFAESLKSLPQGLRAMAATHWLDLSLSLDSVTWHFGNFGEPALVARTEEGLLELGLDELASVFNEATTMMAPFVDQMSPEHPPDEFLSRSGLTKRGAELDSKAWDLYDLGDGRSAIYDAWVRYTRQHPERVFGPDPKLG